MSDTASIWMSLTPFTSAKNIKIKAVNSYFCCISSIFMLLRFAHYTRILEGTLECNLESWIMESLEPLQIRESKNPI